MNRKSGVLSGSQSSDLIKTGTRRGTIFIGQTEEKGYWGKTVNLLALECKGILKVRTLCETEIIDKLGKKIKTVKHSTHIEIREFKRTLMGVVAQVVDQVTFKL